MRKYEHLVSSDTKGHIAAVQKLSVLTSICFTKDRCTLCSSILNNDCNPALVSMIIYSRQCLFQCPGRTKHR